MDNYLIINARIVNQGSVVTGFVLVRGGVIRAVAPGAPQVETDQAEVIDAGGKYLIPGVIDDHVHFREPGLTHKAEIATESKAAVAGGVTTYMEMPNTSPPAVTIAELEQKYARAAEVSLANYSFYLGATADNIREIKNLDPASHCGVKLFMGSSTGNMMVNNPGARERIFAESPALLAVHCEDDSIIRRNLAAQEKVFGENIPIGMHPQIRSEEACFRSSALAVELARKHQTRLHILHVSTARELELFEKGTDFEKKKITGEACIHHLWFHDADYERKGSLIKWNPAVKTAGDRDALLNGLLEDRLDVIATDHAPHAIEEKQNNYSETPSGGPMVQHSLVAMLELVHRKKLTIEKVVEKMCHAPAKLFRVKARGFILPGYRADLVLVDMESEWTVSRRGLYYKCGWSPLEGELFHSQVTHTWVNGKLVFMNGMFNEMVRGERVEFEEG
ncbi:MAG TPA: dihydroorotase [Bacteroides sp.]|nr:dihydroorotase [Bacteroides sp.]